MEVDVSQLSKISSILLVMTDESEAAILKHLSSSPDASIEATFPWSESCKQDHAAVVRAMKSLLEDGYVTTSRLIETTFYILTREGRSILGSGSHELLVLKALVETGQMSMSDRKQRKLLKRITTKTDG